MCETRDITLKYNLGERRLFPPTLLPMSRIARIVLEGIPYQITQRGNGRQQVFFDELDYGLYLDLLRIYRNCGMRKQTCYCLTELTLHPYVIMR